MKFASIYLYNYIGIYNGMRLNEIFIDMTKCKNRITIIRGDNGSGKSTLSKAMNLFPDSNDSFIPGLPAKKEIVLLDGEVVYKLTFVHGIKQNGDRETTKAYITKTFNNYAVELNENGNVSSYKDILYSEFGLDSNFSALSQLSNDDRGLADKKPAERKRFVNSIISSLETYNNIYKSLTKKSSNYKSMINAIVAKLNILGDEKSLLDKLDALEIKINNLQEKKDMAIATLAQENSIISLLDPDGSIQIKNNDINNALKIKNNELQNVNKIIEGLILKNNAVKGENFDLEYKTLIDKKNSLIIRNKILKNEIESLMLQKENEASQLSEKIQKLSVLQSGIEYESINTELKIQNEKICMIESELHDKVGLDNISSINKEEYILALETLKDLYEYISIFKSSTDFDIMQKIIDEYVSNGKIPNRYNIKDIDIKISDLENKLFNYNTEIAQLKGRIPILEKLNLKPDSCNNEMCEFIKDAIEFQKTNPQERLEQLLTLVNSLMEDIESLKMMKQNMESVNDSINSFSVIIRDIDKNGSVLSKMPNGEMFKDKRIFLDRIISGYGFEYMSQMYQYIDLANLIDIYKQSIDLRDNLLSELKSYDSKFELIKSINDDINSINHSISVIADKITPINDEMLENDKIIVKIQELEGIYDAIFIQLEEKHNIEIDMSNLSIELNKNSSAIKDIESAILRASVAKENIVQISYTMESLMKERDKVLHSVQMMKDYNSELEELKNNYEFIETIKYYSSPTTGIQLVFMELYMGKIIALANELLSLLFNGQFVIQPFVINESEFRIPCLGGGYLNDDISSMSSSQICMISMILSFSLLHHSSTKYNIIKLDEIDGPLDYNNRLFFMDVLNNIMDIMNTEQCIMISHNSELQVDDSDVILLRHDENNSEYQRGNIIWSF